MPPLSLLHQLSPCPRLPMRPQAVLSPPLRPNFMIAGNALSPMAHLAFPTVN